MEHLDAVLLSLAAIWAIAFPAVGATTFARVEAVARRVARSTIASCVLAALLPLTVRLALLPFESAPMPQVHDEYSYLLQADTLAEGRLANPTHPLWRHFDTIHVNQRPTYCSKYPIGQGVALFLGERIVGSPWAGVLASFAAASAAVVWALRGWVSPMCALVGGVFFGFQLGFMSNFVDSYMGGAVAAIGGALIVGSWGRLRRGGAMAAGIGLGAGVMVLMHSRPYEGLLASLPPLAALLLAVRRADRERWRKHLRALACAGLVGGLGLAFLGYYNVRTTGSTFETPYMVHQRAYHVVPLFLWGDVSPAPEYSAESVAGLYRDWCVDTYNEVNGFRRWLESRPQDFSYAWFVLVGSPMTALLLLGHRSALAPGIRPVWSMPLAVSAGLAAATWVVPHYFAPAVAALYVPITAATKEVWQRGSRPATFVRAVALAVLVAQLMPITVRAMRTPWRGTASLAARACFEDVLRGEKGQDLVIVRYGEDHNVHREWVYNRAEIDAAEVVWAHDFGETKNRDLLDRMRERRVWLARPDEEPPSITPYGASDLATPRALAQCGDIWLGRNPPKRDDE